MNKSHGGKNMEDKIPRLKDDYTQEAIAARHDFIKEKTGVAVNHVGRYSFDPAILKGNIESFIGVAQVPIGIAGPLLLNGENAQGEFYVPMATTEGTLMASYNRGMKLVHQCGGVKTTIVDDAMQRAPVFVFDDARDAKNFSHWVTEHFADIKEVTDKTSSIGRLRNIEHYAAGELLRLRNITNTGAMLAGSTNSGPTASRPSLSPRVRMWPMWPSLRRPSYSLNRRPITAITFQSPSPP
jgi:hydroxymethylglutaryl-CoA reductase (NADPH)